MKRLVLTVAMATLCAGFTANAQQAAGSPEGGISAEMLSEKRFRKKDLLIFLKSLRFRVHTT